MSDLPRAVEGEDWLRLKLLIQQTEDRVKLWEAEERVAERRWHRGVREVDRRGLTNLDRLGYAYMQKAAEGRLWVPEQQLAKDRCLLEDLYRLRDAMLEATDGSECEGGS